MFKLFIRDKLKKKILAFLAVCKVTEKLLMNYFYVFVEIKLNIITNNCVKEIAKLKFTKKYFSYNTVMEIKKNRI